jgi:hypothetical protein
MFAQKAKILNRKEREGRKGSEILFLRILCVLPALAGGARVRG